MIHSLTYARAQYHHCSWVVTKNHLRHYQRRHHLLQGRGGRRLGLQAMAQVAVDAVSNVEGG